MTEKKTSLLQKEPLMLLLLGACPALAATIDVRAALGMGLIVLGTLLVSGVVVALLSGKIADETRFITGILTAAGCASVMNMLTAAFLPTAHGLLGVYGAVVAVIALTNVFADEAADAESVGAAAKRALRMGICFLGVLLVTAAIREVLGAASFAGMSLDFLQNFKISAMVKAPGAYIVLAIVAAVIRVLGHGEKKEEK